MVSPFPYELTILLQTPKHLYKITFMVSHVPSVYKTILWFFTYASYSFSVNINSVQKFLSSIIMSNLGSYALLAVQNTKKNHPTWIYMSTRVHLQFTTDHESDSWFSKDHISDSLFARKTYSIAGSVRITYLRWWESDPPMCMQANEYTNLTP